MVDKDRCDIVLPVHNGLPYLKPCLDSLFRNTDYSFRLIIVDDASLGDTKDYINSIKDAYPDIVETIFFAKNEGAIKAMNEGLKRTNAKYVCLLNTDTILCKDWLGKIIDVAQKNNDIGLLNPSSSVFGDTPRSQQLKDIEDFADSLRGFNGKFQEMANCVGFCMVIKRELLEKIGFLSNDFGLGYFEDLDFSRRAQKLGYKSVKVLDSYVYHYGKRTFEKLKNREDIIKDNKATFERKWGNLNRLAIVNILPKNLDETIQMSLELAREWNLVYLYYFKNNKLNFDRNYHGNVRLFAFNPFFSLWLFLYIGAKIITHSLYKNNSKRFNAIIIDNKVSAFVVKYFSALWSRIDIFYIKDGKFILLGKKRDALSKDEFINYIKYKY